MRELVGDPARPKTFRLDKDGELDLLHVGAHYGMGESATVRRLLEEKARAIRAPHRMRPTPAAEGTGYVAPACSFGDKLRAARGSTSLRKLSVDLGFPRNSSRLSEIERGMRDPCDVVIAWAAERGIVWEGKR